MFFVLFAVVFVLNMVEQSPVLKGGFAKNALLHLRKR